jgi:hypothetical protein
MDSLKFSTPIVQLAANAFGHSGAVQVRFALPGERVDYPLALEGDPAGVRYEWLRVNDSTVADSARALTGDSLVAPADAGFYHLAVLRAGRRESVNGPTLAVLVPFDAKHGAVLDGYRIGTYLAESDGDVDEPLPEGFVKVTEDEAELPITKHLRLADFLVRDGQQSWPRYAAVSPRVLDKLELVVERVSERLRASGTVPGDVQVEVNVHSAFRSPAYNRTVRRAARDSRHQYGDAVDVAIDANGDGRLDRHDTEIIARIVDEIESEYPDLVGGMGVYTSRAYEHPYVHIDARGRRARWRG